MDGQKISNMLRLDAFEPEAIVPVVHQGVNRHIPARLLKGEKGDPGESIKGDPGDPGPPGITADVFLLDVYNWAGNQSVANGAFFNLLGLTGLTKAIATAETTLNAGVLKLPAKNGVTQVLFTVRLSGTVGGPSGTDREWIVELRRPGDNSVVAADAESKLDGSDISNRDVVLSSYTNGAADAFTLNGVNLGVSNISGNTMTLTSVSIRIGRTVNPQ